MMTVVLPLLLAASNVTHAQDHEGQNSDGRITKG